MWLASCEAVIRVTVTVTVTVRWQAKNDGHSRHNTGEWNMEIKFTIRTYTARVSNTIKRRRKVWFVDCPKSDRRLGDQLSERDNERPAVGGREKTGGNKAHKGAAGVGTS
jgi:hypothetical protein